MPCIFILIFISLVFTVFIKSYKIMYYSNSGRQRSHSQNAICPAICPHGYFNLTQRGVHQAQRNKSSEVWWAMGNGDSSYPPFEIQYCYGSARTSISNNKKEQQEQKEVYKIQRPMTEGKQKVRFQQAKAAKDQSFRSQQKSGRGKNVSFSLLSNEKQAKQYDTAKQNKVTTLTVNKSVKQNNGPTLTLNRSLGKNIAKSPQKSPQKKKLTPEQELKRQIFLKECYSIQEYLKSNKANTRQLPNSAIKLFYDVPCIEAYGRKNTSGNNGFIYNDFMKTHNVLPHRMGNEPVKYQSYRSALNFCKRAKIDPEERWKKIHRQMRKKLDMKLLVEYFAEGAIDINTENLEQALKLNINTLQGVKFERSKSMENLTAIPISERLNLTMKTEKADFNTTKGTEDTSFKQMSSDRITSLKRSKSWGKKEYLFLYKFKNSDGETQYCKDRHGITCYVDPSFEENKDAYVKFLKKIKPIYAEDVAPGDRNLDQQMLNNFVASQNPDVPKHYLMPNCDEPEKYRPQKYSIKARRKSLVAEAKPVQ